MARDTSKSRGGRGRRGSGSKGHALEQMERKGARKKSLWRRLLGKNTSGHPALSGRVVVQDGDEALVFVDGRSATFHKGATIDTGRVMTAREYEALAMGPRAAERSYQDRDASTKVLRLRSAGNLLVVYGGWSRWRDKEVQRLDKLGRELCPGLLERN